MSAAIARGMPSVPVKTTVDPASGPDGFPAQGLQGVGHREEEALDERSEVDFLAEVELRALEFDDGHREI